MLEQVSFLYEEDMRCLFGQDSGEVGYVTPYIPDIEGGDICV